MTTNINYEFNSEGIKIFDRQINGKYREYPNGYSFEPDTLENTIMLKRILRLKNKNVDLADGVLYFSQMSKYYESAKVAHNWQLSLLKDN
jgi:hypothetical protein